MGLRLRLLQSLSLQGSGGDQQAKSNLSEVLSDGSKVSILLQKLMFVGQYKQFMLSRDKGEELLAIIHDADKRFKTYNDDEPLRDLGEVICDAIGTDASEINQVNLTFIKLREVVLYDKELTLGKLSIYEDTEKGVSYICGFGESESQSFIREVAEWNEITGDTLGDLSGRFIMGVSSSGATYIFDSEAGEMVAFSSDGFDTTSIREKKVNEVLKINDLVTDKCFITQNECGVIVGRSINGIWHGMIYDSTGGWQKLSSQAYGPIGNAWGTISFNEDLSRGSIQKYKNNSEYTKSYTFMVAE